MVDHKLQGIVPWYGSKGSPSRTAPHRHKKESFEDDLHGLGPPSCRTAAEAMLLTSRSPSPAIFSSATTSSGGRAAAAAAVHPPPAVAVPTAVTNA
mmetsp:Transcript_35873/g.101572  ORF Transcript_35873/g.101572 Transcript_35873/m.101572 type:complete len:96 (-) Transcript_35873:1533-1820(-)